MRSIAPSSMGDGEKGESAEYNRPSGPRTSAPPGWKPPEASTVVTDPEPSTRKSVDGMSGPGNCGIGAVVPYRLPSGASTSRLEGVPPWGAVPGKSKSFVNAPAVVIRKTVP